MSGAVASRPPLAGLRVVESSLLGPGAITTHLADLGADVIKVESPGGDYIREMTWPIVEGVSLLHLHVHRGKRSIVLDLRKPEYARRLERALLASREPDDCWLPCHHDLNPANLLGSRPWVIDWEYGAAGHPGFEVASIQRTHGWSEEQRRQLESCYLEGMGTHKLLNAKGFQADAFLPWVDYIGLLWALLMAERQPGPEYQALIDTNRQRLE